MLAIVEKYYEAHPEKKKPEADATTVRSSTRLATSTQRLNNALLIRRPS